LAHGSYGRSLALAGEVNHHREATGRFQGLHEGPSRTVLCGKTCAKPLNILNAKTRRIGHLNQGAFGIRAEAYRWRQSLQLHEIARDRPADQFDRRAVSGHFDPKSHEFGYGQRVHFPVGVTLAIPSFVAKHCSKGRLHRPGIESVTVKTFCGERELTLTCPPERS